jgi:hypothetical protein
MGPETSRTEALTRIPYDELEIVGFNETVKEVPCARVCPVVRRTTTDDFFPLLTATGGADVWTRAELESLRVENHVTLLPESERIPAFPSAMMLYATSAFMAATESELPASFNKEKLHKWTLPHNGSETMVICASSKTIEALMNDWAERLMSKTTRLLIQFFAHQYSRLDKEAEQSRKEAEKLARMARSSAINRTLRSRVLLRLGVSLIYSETPERWDNLRAIVLRNFPGWKSETLDEQLALFVKRLRMQIPQRESETIKTNGKNNNDKKEIIETVISIVGIVDEETRREMAQAFTREHRELHPVNETILSRIEETLVQQGARYDPWICLEDRELVLALAGEEALYHPDVFKVLPTRGPAINLVGFLRKKKGELLLSGVDDLIDAASLASKLKTPSDPLSKYLRSRLSEPTNKLLEQYQSSQQPSQELKELLVDEFNILINGTSLYEDKRFTNVQLTKDTQELIGQIIQGPGLLRLNRMLLEDAYPQEIATHRSAVAARVQMAAAGNG